MTMQLTTIRIDKPDATNFILGQTHFIKSVEDIHETLVGAVPGIKFGLAFCEASGKCLVRSSGTDVAMVQLAQKNAMALGAGHCFIVFLGEGYYPVNVLNAIKTVPEVCRFSARLRIRSRWSWPRPTREEDCSAQSTGFLRRGSRARKTSRGGKNLLRQLGYKL